MENVNLLESEKLWFPFSFLGITHPLTAINTSTIIYTWITLLIIFFTIFIARKYIYRTNSIGQYIIKSFVKSFSDLITQSTGKFVYRYYLFITSLFIFIVFCNWISLLPYLEEPTKDLNTTLSLGIIAFIYSQKEVIKSHGLLAYLKDFFMPLAIPFPLNLIVGLIMLPLKLLAELSSVISISFRLFGNIFGGFVIAKIFHQFTAGSIVKQLFSSITGVNLLIMSFFIIFEGFLQAFVFAILSLTNIAMAVQTENEGFH